MHVKRSSNMTHYDNPVATNSMLPPRANARRQLRTAGNPIGIMDQNERRSMAGAQSSFGPASRSGLHTSAEITRNNRRRHHNMHASQSGVTASTLPQQRPPVFGKYYQGSAGRPTEGMKQEFASSASSLPHMGSQFTTANQTARSGGF